MKQIWTIKTILIFYWNLEPALRFNCGSVLPTKQRNREGTYDFLFSWSWDGWYNVVIVLIHSGNKLFS